MNKYQIALDELEFASVQYYGDKENYFAVEDMIENSKVLQELVDKVTPKKVKGRSITYDGVVGNCPTCNAFLRKCDRNTFCKHCGQALDWEGR